MLSEQFEHVPDDEDSIEKPFPLPNHFFDINVNVLIIHGFNVCQVSVTKNVFQCPCTAELGDTEDGPR